MARVANVNIPDQKRIVISLTYIFGVGANRAKQILVDTKIDDSRRTKDLTEDELNLIRTAVTKYTIEGDLRREVLTHIRRLKDIKSYRGSRHIKHLPARGQRTKTNNRTVRGNVRRTMGSGRAGAAQKT